MGEKECINILPVVGGGSNTDTATAMAMMNNNPWMYLVMLALFGGGNWGFGNRGGVGPGAAALDIETQNKLNSLQAQINDNNNNQWAREYLDTLQAVKWCNYLTAKEAEQIVAKMKPQPLWNRTAWEGMMTNLGLPMQDEPYYNQIGRAHV